MTVSTIANRVSYTGNGATQDFAFPFKILDNSHMAVYLDGVQKYTGFTVTGAGGNSGNVHFANAPGVSVLVALVRAQPYTQVTDIAPNGPFPAKTVETMADKAMIAAQQTLDTETLALRCNPGDAATLNPLPIAPSRANFLLAFDAFGQPIPTSFTQAQVASAIAAAYAGTTGPLDALHFIQAGFAATDRTAQAKARDMVSVKDFGAVDDGVTDSTAAFVACANYCIASKKAMYMPGNGYVISTVPITDHLRVYGDGREITSVTVSGGVGFDVLTESSCTFAGFSMLGTGAPGTMAIRLDGATGNGNIFSLLRDLYLYNFATGLETRSAYAWVCDNVIVDAYTNAGIRVRNLINADAGDSTICNCLIVNGSGGTSVAIDHRSSGGLRVVNNKLNIGAYGYRLLLDPGISTSVLVLGHNSLENFTIAAVQLANLNLTSVYSGIIIDGNEISLNGWGIISNPAVAQYFGNVAITNNTITVTAGTYGINLTYVSNVIVNGNTIVGANLPGQYGVVYAATVGGKHGVNSIGGFPTGQQIVNAGGVFMANQRPTTGTVAVNCATPYGPLYYGSAAVAFAQPYDAAPTVRCSQSSVAGFVSAWPSAVTAAGFTMNTLSVTNGGAGNALWNADGQ